ncbi:MAG: heterodisulfide reductase-related iron-sulfur binding cluster, partial [Acidobacteriota bacterium]
PNDPKFWDRAELDKEVHRTFDLCNGCRMCFKYCQSFPTLFDAVDRAGDVRLLPMAKVDQVVDECFQCKLCYTTCPYTEKEGHEFKLDFPRLVMRANAIRRRERGIPFREQVLADPDRIGSLATKTPALANWANQQPVHRILMEKVLGVHRDKLLPSFESPTFEEWTREQTGPAAETAAGTHPVVLFSTCYVNYNNPEIGRAAFRVLAHNECKVACPSLNCCGMPALDSGDIIFATKQAKANVERLLPLVERGYKVAVINPTCSLMLKTEYPDLLDDPANPALAAAARTVAASTRDLGEFLFELRQAGQFKEDFKSTPDGPVAYHAPCHLRMQSVGYRGRDLMRRIPQVQPRLVAECCGHDGTWAMKVENFEASLKNGQKAFDGMREAGSELWTTECPLAALQFKQACGREVLHPVQVLDRAYQENGFATAVAPKPDEGKTT